MPSSSRVARRIWWFTVSNAADRLRRMRTDERDEALAAPVAVLGTDEPGSRPAPYLWGAPNHMGGATSSKKKKALRSGFQ